MGGSVAKTIGLVSSGDSSRQAGRGGGAAEKRRLARQRRRAEETGGRGPCVSQPPPKLPALSSCPFPEPRAETDGTAASLGPGWI